MWINRTISPSILKQAAIKPAILLTGARQTGKSSLLKQLVPDAEYVSFDNTALADEAEHSPDSFLKQLRLPVIIDEVQYVPSIFRALKLHIDHERNVSGRYFLTGSQQFSLMQGVTESLAGRIAIFDLSSFSADEIRSASLSPTDLPQRGGFPELWVHPEQETAQFYADYVTTYLERDLRSLINVDSLRVFDRFLRSLALRTAGLLNLSEIAREIGVSANTAGRWLDALIASGIVQLLEPWHTKEAQRLVKTPKLYFRDNGLLCHLLRIHRPTDWRIHAMAGHIWENLVFCELSRFLSSTGAGRDLWFWRQKDGYEIDFILEHNGQTTLLEAKLAERPDKRDVHFERFGRGSDQQGNTRCVVACLQPETRALVQAEFTTFNPLTTSIRAVVS